jgi:predicted metal-dependent peptidase
MIASGIAEPMFGYGLTQQKIDVIIILYYSKRTKTMSKTDTDVIERLTVARIGMLIRSPFFGNLITRMKLINAADWCPTAATDGRNFYFNPDFIRKLDKQELEFLLGHEVLHMVYDHIARVGDRDRQLSNIAQDYVVNADLIDYKVGRKITAVPCLYDAKYAGWTWEAVYDDLYEKAEKIDIDKLVEQMLDQHIQDQEGNGGGEDGEEGQGQKRNPLQMSAAEREELRKEMKQAILEAAQSVGASKLPAGIQRLVREMTEHKMNWREILQQKIQSCFKSDFTWMRPNRKGWHMEAVMPGMKPGEMVDVCVAIDVSGSISEQQARDLLGEVAGIIESYDEYRVHVMTFDTAVYNPQVFSSDNMSDIKSYEIVGGGGTDFSCVWHHLQDNDIVPKQLIMFTDGYDFGDKGAQFEGYCPTMFLIHSNPKFEPGWDADVIQYDERS